MTSKFCPTCVSSRKNKKAPHTRDSNVEDDDDDDDGGFYEPASSSQSPSRRRIPRHDHLRGDNNDDDINNDDFLQPFEVPQIFRPIRVDSPALDSVRPRPKPNIKTRYDSDGKANVSSSYHQPDIIPSPPEATIEKNKAVDDSQYEEIVAPTRIPPLYVSSYSKDEECNSSISSRSLSSLLNQLPEDESSRPLLSTSDSQLDLQDEEEDTTLLQLDPIVPPKDKNNPDELDLTPRASPIPPDDNDEDSPPPVPSCPPPLSSESEYEHSAASNSSSRSISRERSSSKIPLHRSFQSQMNSDCPGLFSLSLVDMSSIRYADSASSYCSESPSREHSRSRSCSLGASAASAQRNFLPVNRLRNNHNNNNECLSSSGINCNDDHTSPSTVDVATSTGTSFEESNNYFDNYYPDATTGMVSIGIGTDGIYYNEEEEGGSRSATPTQEHPSFPVNQDSLIENSLRSLNEDHDHDKTLSTSSIRITLKNSHLENKSGGGSADAISSKRRSNLDDDDIIPVHSQSYPSLSRKSTSNANTHYGNTAADDDSGDYIEAGDAFGESSSSGICLNTETTEDETPTTSGQELQQDVNSSKVNYGGGECNKGNNRSRWLYQLRNGSFKCNSNLISTTTTGSLDDPREMTNKREQEDTSNKDSWLSLSSSIEEEVVDDKNNTSQDRRDEDYGGNSSSPSPNLSQISNESLPENMSRVRNEELIKIPKKLSDNNQGQYRFGLVQVGMSPILCLSCVHIHMMPS